DLVEQGTQLLAAVLGGGLVHRVILSKACQTYSAGMGSTGGASGGFSTTWPSSAGSAAPSPGRAGSSAPAGSAAGSLTSSITIGSSTPGSSRSPEGLSMKTSTSTASRAMTIGQSQRLFDWWGAGAGSWAGSRGAAGSPGGIGSPGTGWRGGAGSVTLSSIVARERSSDSAAAPLPHQREAGGGVPSAGPPPGAPLFGRGGSRLGGAIGRRAGLAFGHRGHRRFGQVDRHARSGLADDQFAPAQILGIRLVGRFLAFAAGGEREGEAGGGERQQRAGG